MTALPATQETRAAAQRPPVTRAGCLSSIPASKRISDRRGENDRDADGGQPLPSPARDEPLRWSEPFGERARETSAAKYDECGGMRWNAARLRLLSGTATSAQAVAQRHTNVNQRLAAPANRKTSHNLNRRSQPKRASGATSLAGGECVVRSPGDPAAARGGPPPPFRAGPARAMDVPGARVAIRLELGANR